MPTKLSALDSLVAPELADLIYAVDVSADPDVSRKLLLSDLIKAIGGKVPLETITNSTAGEFDFDNIPGGYKRLIIEGYARGDVSASGDNVYVFLNEDLTAANYHTQSMFAGNGSVFGTEFNFPFLGAVAAGTSPAGAFGSFRIVLEDYTGSNLKTAMADFMSPREVDNTTVSKTAIVSAITAAITRIRIRTDNHATDQLTGELTLYGEL